ncbi:MAG: cobalamin-binding protein, partial [Candidatus Aminicenantes bacterium]|nr:cobalamin-binding protein [Candidatus Aminicenantes bacterium]
MTNQITFSDTIGLAKTELDVHTLGLSSINEILRECGFKTIVTDSIISKAFSEPRELNNFMLIEKWICENKITVLGFSYRLDIDDGVLLFKRLMNQLEKKKLLKVTGGHIKKIYFAGLP